MQASTEKSAQAITPASSSTSGGFTSVTTVQQSTTQQQNFTLVPVTTSDTISMPISLSPASTPLLSTHTDTVEPTAPETFNGHELIGSAGPDKRESEGIQKALDLLREKRSQDFGWENDTHMVILAKEVIF